MFYNPKNPEIFESFFISTAENTSNTFELNDLSELQDTFNFINEEFDFSLIGDHKLMTNTSFSSTDTQYKPDSNIIIISTLFNASESRSGTISVLANNLNNVPTDKKKNSSSIDLIIDDNKINKTLQEDFKSGDNPLYDPLIHGLKKLNKSQLLPDDTDKKSDSSKDMFSEKNKINENIFFLDDDSEEKKDKNAIKKNITFKSKKYKLLLQNYSKQEDCCLDIYELFDQRLFFETLIQNFKLIYNKKLIGRLKVPEMRNLEIVDRNFFKFLQKRDKKKRASCFGYYKALIGFLIMAFIYFLFIIIAVNVDFLNVHIS